MTTLADNIISLLVGFSLTIEIPYVLNPELPGTTLLLGQSVNAFVYTLVVCLMVLAYPDPGPDPGPGPNGNALV